MTGAALATASGARALRPARDILPMLIFLAFALLPVVASLTARQYLLDVGARMMVFAVAAVALDLLVGYAGLISFGHAAFIGLGAYAVGILAAHGINDALVALPAAIAVSMLFAWLTGIVCLRTKGAYFIMITLAFGQMVYFIAVWSDNCVHLARHDIERHIVGHDQAAEVLADTFEAKQRLSHDRTTATAGYRARSVRREQTIRRARELVRK